MVMKAMVQPAAVCALVVVGVGLGLVACGDTRCAIDPCDIREASCQRAVLEVAHCVRGSSGAATTVPVYVVDADRYIDEQVELAANAEITDEERAADQAWYRGLALFDLGGDVEDAGDTTRVRLEQLAAFYDTDDRAITILDRGEPFDGIGSGLLLLHETLHALQDADYDLEALYEPAETLDRSLAVSALIEGEATFYSSIAAGYTYGFAPEDVDYGRAFDAYRSSSEERLLREDEPIIRLRSYFAYPYGGSYVHAAWKHGGEGGVRALFDDPPESEREVIFGPSDHELEADTWFETSLADRAIPVLDDSFEHQGSVQYGSLGVLAFLQRHVWSYSESLGDLRSVQTDVFSVLSDGEQTVAVWRIRFSSESGARAILRALYDPSESDGYWEHGAFVDGRDLVLVASSSSDLLPESLEDLTWTAVPETEDPPAAEANAAVDAHGVRIECARHPLDPHAQ